MTKNKNHLTHLKALNLLKDTPEFADMHYLIVGRGEEWASLEETAKELGIADHVHFMGYRTDAPDFYRCSDLFLFMTYREGLSVALMEAMGSGLPVVCSRIRGNTDLVDDSVSGLFAEITPEATAEAILKMYRDKALRESCGAAAAEKVKLFDNENVHRLVKDIYLSV